MNKMLKKYVFIEFYILINLYLYQIRTSFKFYHNFNITIYAKKCNKIVWLYETARQL
jgi:hypothetical protein